MNRVLKTHIRTFRTREGIETLRDFWNFCSPGRDADLDFYLFIVDHYPETIRPHVVVLYEYDAPKALLAGQLDATSVPIRLGYFVFPVPKMRILQFVHGGWLGDISEASARLLVGSVVETLAVGEADAALFHYPDLGSPLVHWAARLPGRLCSDHLVRPQAHRVRDISVGDGTFLAGVSRNARYQQRKRERRIKQDFSDCALARLTKPDEIGRLIGDAEAVAKKSYQRGLGTGFYRIPIVRARLEFEAGMGWLRAYILYLDKRPAAFWIGSLRNGTFLSDYLAFDPVHAQYAPGLYLIMKAIEDLSEDPNVCVQRIDFGIGDATYKERLGNGEWLKSPVYIFAPNVKGVSMNASRSAIGVLDHSAKSFMGMTPLMGRIKQTWRTHMTE